MSKEMRKLTIAVIILSLVIFSPYFFSVINPEEKDKGVEKSINNSKGTPFDEIELEAKSAYVFDIIKGEAIFELNPYTQLPLASLTKVMTAIVAKEQIPIETVITIPKKALEKEGDDSLFVNEKWLLSDLIDFTMTKSSNDAAYAIAANVEQILRPHEELSKINDFPEEFPVFVYLMNKKANGLNLEQTYFLNETGLDISSNFSGAYGSVSDVAKMMQYAFREHPDIFDTTSYESVNLYSLNYGKHEIENSNQYINSMTQVIASKTGFTDLAGGNLAIIFDAGFSRPFIAVVMGSSKDGRFFDMKKLINTTFDWLQQK